MASQAWCRATVVGAVLVLAVAVAACGGGSEAGGLATPTAQDMSVEATSTAAPPATATAAATPTATATPTETAIPTETPVPTQTPAPTETATPPAATAPQPARVPPTATPLPPTATPTATPPPPTATPTRTPAPTPTARITAADGPRLWYGSYHPQARATVPHLYYYCDLDEGWRNLNPAYVGVFPSEESLLEALGHLLTKAPDSRC